MISYINFNATYLWFLKWFALISNTDFFNSLYMHDTNNDPSPSTEITHPLLIILLNADFHLYLQE